MSFPPHSADHVRAAASMREWDTRPVVPRHGFGTVDNYYKSMSVGPRLPDVQLPALIVHSDQDPMIPTSTFSDLLAVPTPNVESRVIPRGPRRLPRREGCTDARGPVAPAKATVAHAVVVRDQVREFWSTPMALSRDGTRAVAINRLNTAAIVNTDGSGTPTYLRGHQRSLTDLAFSPDGRVVVTASDDATLRIWRVENPERFTVLRGHTDWVTRLAISPTGDKIASASRDQTVRLWALEGDGDPLSVFSGDCGGLAFSPDGVLLAAACSGGAIRVWRTDGSNQEFVLRGNESWVRTLEFSPGGRFIASNGSFDDPIRLWRIDTPTEIGDMSRSAILELACQHAGRNLSEEEWNEYFPERPQIPICPRYPSPYVARRRY